MKLFEIFKDVVLDDIKDEPLSIEELIDITNDLIHTDNDLSAEEFTFLNMIKTQLEQGNLSDEELIDIESQLADYIDVLDSDIEDDEVEQDYEIVSESVLVETDNTLIVERIIKRIRGGKLQKIKVVKKKRKGFGLISGKRTPIKVRMAAKRRGIKKRGKKKRGATLRKLRKSLRRRKVLIRKKPHKKKK